MREDVYTHVRQRETQQCEITCCPFLSTSLKTWFGEHMFQSNFRFYKGYPNAVFKTSQEYLNYIDTLPFVDTAEIFGLHPNADIT